jgi:hypothetical protein
MSEFCTRHKDSAPRVYFIRANSSLGWPSDGDDFTLLAQPIRTESVCSSCLTREEVVKLLAPAALFCIENVMGGRGDGGPAGAALMYQVGPAYSIDLEAAARKLLNG